MSKNILELPDDILYYLLIQIDYDEYLNLSKTCKYIYDKYHYNCYFWKNKAIINFHITPELFPDNCVNPQLKYIEILSKNNGCTYGSEIYRPLDDCLERAVNKINTHLIIYFLSKCLLHVDADLTNYSGFYVINMSENPDIEFEKFYYYFLNKGMYVNSISKLIDYHPDIINQYVGLSSISIYSRVYILFVTILNNNWTLLSSIIKTHDNINLDLLLVFSGQHEKWDIAINLCKMGANSNISMDQYLNKYYVIENWNIIFEFIKLGANPDIAIKRAGILNQWDIVFKLIDLGANPNIKIFDSLNPLSYITLIGIATNKLEWDIMDRLIQLGSSSSDAIYYVAVNKRWDIVEELLKKGADPNKIIEEAGRQEKWDLVDNLIKRGANPCNVLIEACKQYKYDLLFKILKSNNTLNASKINSIITILAEKQEWETLIEIVELIKVNKKEYIKFAVNCATKHRAWKIIAKLATLMKEIK